MGTLCFSRELSRHAKGPISKDDFPGRDRFSPAGENVTVGDKEGNGCRAATKESVAVGASCKFAPFLRTLPKKAGNIFLFLREWGVILHQVALAGGIC